MKLKTLKKLGMLLCAAVFSSALFAEGAVDNQLISQQSKSRNSRSNMQRDPNTWRPYYMKLRDAEPMKTSFYQQNVGLGFLYFSGIRGNLEPTQAARGATTNVKSNKKLEGHLSYNRTPLFEAIVGMDIFNWWKIGLSLQHQGGVVVSTKPQEIFSRPVAARTPVDLFAHVRLDAMMFKTYFMFPYVLVWKNIYHEPYLGVGVGPGWQTWTNIQTQYTGGGNVVEPVNLRPKFSANCTFNVDLGFKLRKAMQNYMMSFTLGCKWNYWGQARSMGKLRDQYPDSRQPAGLANRSTERTGLSNPLRIKEVYQFAPYVGVQFNF